MLFTNVFLIQRSAKPQWKLKRRSAQLTGTAESNQPLLEKRDIICYLIRDNLCWLSPPQAVRMCGRQGGSWGAAFATMQIYPAHARLVKATSRSLFKMEYRTKKMTGQSQSKAGQGNWVPSGVENGLDSFKRVKNPKSAFFRSTIPVLTQRHRQHKAAWIHRWFTPNQLLASVLKKTLKLSVSLCFIICFLPISSESIPALIGDSAIENLLIQIPPSSAESQWEEGRKKPNSTFYFSPFK